MDSNGVPRRGVMSGSGWFSVAIEGNSPELICWIVEARSL